MVLDYHQNNILLAIQIIIDKENKCNFVKLNIFTVYWNLDKSKNTCEIIRQIIIIDRKN